METTEQCCPRADKHWGWELSEVSVLKVPVRLWYCLHSQEVRFSFLPLTLQVLSLLTPILIYSLSVLAPCLCLPRFLLICSECRLSDLYQGFTTKLCCGPTRFSIAPGQLLPCVFCLKVSCGVSVLFLIALHWSWPPCSRSFVFFLFLLSFVYVSFNPCVTSSILCLVLIAVLCVPWPVFHDVILAGFDFCS